MFASSLCPGLFLLSRFVPFRVQAVHYPRRRELTQRLEPSTLPSARRMIASIVTSGENVQRRAKESATKIPLSVSLNGAELTAELSSVLRPKASFIGGIALSPRCAVKILRQLALPIFRASWLESKHERLCRHSHKYSRNLRAPGPLKRSRHLARCSLSLSELTEPHR